MTTKVAVRGDFKADVANYKWRAMCRRNLLTTFNNLAKYRGVENTEEFVLNVLDLQLFDTLDDLLHLRKNYSGASNMYMLYNNIKKHRYRRGVKYDFNTESYSYSEDLESRINIIYKYMIENFAFYPVLMEEDLKAIEEGSLLPLEKQFNYLEAEIKLV